MRENQTEIDMESGMGTGVKEYVGIHQELEKSMETAKLTKLVLMLEVAVNPCGSQAFHLNHANLRVWGLGLSLIEQVLIENQMEKRTANDKDSIWGRV